MADVREVFPVLADAVTGAGEPIISRTEGEAAASQAGLIGFAFKDASGNVVLPQLTSDGKIAVDTEGRSGMQKFESGTNAGSTSYQNIVVLDETMVSLSKYYSDFDVSLSCQREAKFQLVHINDVGGTPVEKVLGTWRTGPGQVSFMCHLDNVYVNTSSGTGNQNLIIRGKNTTAVTSDMDATLACLERLVP